MRGASVREKAPALDPPHPRSLRSLDLSPLGRGKNKKEAERRKAQSPTAAPCGAALLRREQHASRRSTAVLAQGTAHPEGSAQARLRGRRRQMRRVAPASTAPTSSDAPRAPVIVPAGMMPEPPECAGDEPNARGHRTRVMARRCRSNICDNYIILDSGVAIEAPSFI